MIVNRTHATVRGRVIAAYPINNTAGGDSVLNFRLAANERQYDPATQTWHDKETFYVTVSCWDGLAKRAAGFALRGQMVVAMGTLATRNYEKDGQRRSYTELRAQHLALDIASVETLRPLPEPKSEASAAADTDAASSDSGTASAPASDTSSSPMTSDAAPATTAATAASVDESRRPAYATAPATDTADLEEDKTPF